MPVVQGQPELHCDFQANLTTEQDLVSSKNSLLSSKKYSRLQNVVSPVNRFSGISSACLVPSFHKK